MFVAKKTSIWAEKTSPLATQILGNKGIDLEERSLKVEIAVADRSYSALIFHNSCNWTERTDKP